MTWSNNRVREDVPFLRWKRTSLAFYQGNVFLGQGIHGLLWPNQSFLDRGVILEIETVL